MNDAPIELRLWRQFVAVAEALRKSGQWKPESGQAPAAGNWNTMNPKPAPGAPKGGG